MIKDDEINRGKKRCCNVVLFPPPTPATRFLLASRQNCHACSYVWCYGFARERERQWSHQHFCGESTKMTQWFPVFVETIIWNEGRESLRKRTLPFKGKMMKTWLFCRCFLGHSCRRHIQLHFCRISFELLGICSF